MSINVVETSLINNYGCCCENAHMIVVPYMFPEIAFIIVPSKTKFVKLFEPSIFFFTTVTGEKIN